MKKIYLIIIALVIGLNISAIPPEPPVGFRWILNEEMSDEFNGKELDTEKWFDFHPNWKGRAPAKFIPEAISVKDGTMQIQNGVLTVPDGNFKYSGGAVVSKKETAYFGYYECKAKASKTRMSTTFWMSSSNTKELRTECANDKYSLELDIQESIGDATNSKFKTHMNSNTHYRWGDCDGNPEVFKSKGANKKLSSEVTEDFHVYGAWWKDASKATFYADNVLGSTVNFTTEIVKEPFNKPMRINMVTETYDWESEPRVEVLKNNSLNTSYYDWIRSYKLIEIDSVETKEEVDNKILINGTFETGDLTGWTTWGGNPVEVNWDDAFEGDYAVYIVGGGAPEQVLSLKKNTDYTLTCFAKVVSGSIMLGVKQNNATNTGVASTSVTNPDYMLVELKFNTGDQSNLKMYFYAVGENDEAYADNFELVEDNPVIEPEKPSPEIFNESIAFSKINSLGNNGYLKFTFNYKVNNDSSVEVELKDKSNKIVAKSSVQALKGYGLREFDLYTTETISVEEEYTVTLKMNSEKGLIDEVSESIKAENKTIINEDRLHNFNCYPNPTNNELHLEGISSNYPVLIYTVTGKLMKEVKLSSTNVVDVSDLESGVYLVSYQNVMQKFVKN